MLPVKKGNTNFDVVSGETPQHAVDSLAMKKQKYRGKKEKRKKKGRERERLKKEERKERKK